MTNDFHYHTIEKPSTAEFRDRGSKFIAYTFPVSDVHVFKQRLVELKKEHPKAEHHCFAYRLGWMEIISVLRMMENRQVPRADPSWGR